MLLDQIEMQLRDRVTGHLQSIWIDVFDNSLSRKWLTALDHLLEYQYHLEKNYCFLGFANSPRSGSFILEQVNRSIDAINRAAIGYQIDDYFDMNNCMTDLPCAGRAIGRNIIHEKFNRLHRYFEDLQGVSGNLSPFYLVADAETRWHIRQLNLLCHEFESWALSWRKEIEAPEWKRPSVLMCWLNAPRFVLASEDFDLFGIETINRPTGGVFVGVNKAVGKHHWEVFNDEGKDSRVGELISTSMRTQTEAAGDFDIEWGVNPRDREWQRTRLADFRSWLVANGFDPDDRSLTIGHPQVAQVDLVRSFGTQDTQAIWSVLERHSDVWSVRTQHAHAVFDYHWSDSDFCERQVGHIQQGK